MSGEGKCLYDISDVPVCGQPQGQASARSADYFKALKMEADRALEGTFFCLECVRRVHLI